MKIFSKKQWFMQLSFALFLLYPETSYGAEEVRFNARFKVGCGDNLSRVNSADMAQHCLSTLSEFSGTTNPNIKAKVYEIAIAITKKWGLTPPAWLDQVAPQVEETVKKLIEESNPAKANPANDNPGVKQAQADFKALIPPPPPIVKPQPVKGKPADKNPGFVAKEINTSTKARFGLKQGDFYLASFGPSTSVKMAIVPVSVVDSSKATPDSDFTFDKAKTISQDDVSIKDNDNLKNIIKQGKDIYLVNRIVSYDNPLAQPQKITGVFEATFEDEESDYYIATATIQNKPKTILIKKDLIKPLKEKDTFRFKEATLIDIDKLAELGKVIPAKLFNEISDDLQNQTFEWYTIESKDSILPDAKGGVKNTSAQEINGLFHAAYSENLGDYNVFSFTSDTDKNNRLYGIIKGVSDQKFTFTKAILLEKNNSILNNKRFDRIKNHLNNGNTFYIIDLASIIPDAQGGVKNAPAEEINGLFHAVVKRRLNGYTIYQLSDEKNKKFNFYGIIKGTDKDEFDFKSAKNTPLSTSYLNNPVLENVKKYILSGQVVYSIDTSSIVRDNQANVPDEEAQLRKQNNSAKFIKEIKAGSIQTYVFKSDNSSHNLVIDQNQLKNFNLESNGLNTIFTKGDEVFYKSTRVNQNNPAVKYIEGIAAFKVNNVLIYPNTAQDLQLPNPKPANDKNLYKAKMERSNGSSDRYIVLTLTYAPSTENNLTAGSTIYFDTKDLKGLSSDLTNKIDRFHQKHGNLTRLNVIFRNIQLLGKGKIQNYFIKDIVDIVE